MRRRQRTVSASLYSNCEVAIEALAEDRSALWARVSGADFLSDAEKRELVGVGS